jgi:hypothetical protein
MRDVLKLYLDNRKIVILTFEIFWIGVFLLEAATGSTGAEVAQFVYANF